MKKFQFRLATLLKVREREEDLAKKELAEAYMELEKVIEAIAQLESERQSADDERKTLHCTAANLAEYADYLDGLRAKITEQQDEMLRLRNVVETKRQVLVLARQKVKALEKLRERRYNQWEEELNRQEQVFLDEVGTTSYEEDFRFAFNSIDRGRRGIVLLFL